MTNQTRVYEGQRELKEQLDEQFARLAQVSQEERELIDKLNQIEFERRLILTAVSQLQRQVRPTVVCKPKRERRVRTRKDNKKKELEGLLKGIKGLSVEDQERVLKILGG